MLGLFQGRRPLGVTAIRSACYARLPEHPVHSAWGAAPHALCPQPLQRYPDGARADC